jgi:hypothetical protein
MHAPYVLSLILYIFIGSILCSSFPIPAHPSDALAGLHDLFVAHPAALTDNLSAMLEAIVECMMDGDKGVRFALLTVLQHVFGTVAAVRMRSHTHAHIHTHTHA